MPKAFPESDFGVNRKGFRFNQNRLKPEIAVFSTMLAGARNQTRLPDSYAKMTGIDTRRKHHSLEDWLIGRADWPALCLDGAADDAARLCRAWLLRHCPSHPDHDAADILIRNGAPGPVGDFLGTGLAKLSQIDAAAPTPWHIFCPSAAAANSDPAAMSAELEARRRLSHIIPPPMPMTDPARELLFTTNALLSPPLDPGSAHIPASLRRDARQFASTPQSFWYDHPVPLDASPAENEILYGLSKLDEALAQEAAGGLLAPGTRIDLAMSISVTHEGMEELASRYVSDLIATHLNLRHLRVFLFDESRCRQIVEHLCPSDAAAADVFGVNGAYGRHYSFLKAVLLLWQVAVNPQARFTFKFDLDQVFDQAALLAQTGSSALQLIANPLWGGSAVDHAGRQVDLGMLAGGLVNEADAPHGLYIPDVPRPRTDLVTAPLTSRRLFCPQWPQAISTEAEILQRDRGYQRIHVTGGTTGITAEALRTWRPFTPGFINRAEDQAYAMAALKEDSYLSHLHADGLIMRHDKQAFAGRSIAHASTGKAVGDIERLLLFSRYAELHGRGLAAVRDHLWPFTSCFVHPDAGALAGLIFALDGAAQGGRFVAEGAPRLMRCLNFCDQGMERRLQHEQAGWQAIYDSLSAGRRFPGALTEMIRPVSL